MNLFWVCVGVLLVYIQHIQQIVLQKKSNLPHGDRFVASNCRSPLLGRNFVCSDSERRLLQDEDHSSIRLHSIPGLCLVCSDKSLERFPSGPVLAGSEEFHQVQIERLKCCSPSY